MKYNLWGLFLAAGFILPSFHATAQSAGRCGETATKISKIQGEGHASELTGKEVTVKAIVSAVMPELGGYFLIEEASDWDDSDQSSEGIYVFDKVNKPKVGNTVSLLATVAEFKGQTQLERVKDIKACSQGETIKYTTLGLPLKHKDQLESLEGMPVIIEQSLTISENYNLSRYGQLLLSNGRLFQGSNVALPGKAANQVDKANRLNQIILDDGSTVKNPPLDLQPDHLYRVGNQVKGLQGVMYFAFGNFMLEPTKKPQYIATNERKVKPKAKPEGALRVASFNVLNYFNGEGAQKTFPSKRGASSLAEFDRQNAKTIAAMTALDADVFGLMEVENDGYGKDSAIQELTSNLAKASGRNYVFIDPKVKRFGEDAIAVGMIYDADKVEPVGKTVTLNQPPFGHKSRLPMAQTFRQKANGEVFTLVVNHFKSKGRCPKDKADPNADQKDGQACWNHARTQSAQLLSNWLKANPTEAGDSDVLIIGDLNAYAKEQPVTTLEQAGYVNMLEKHQGKYAYSYVYKGLSGYLDHALASQSLSVQVLQTFDWHINADELSVSDYNLESKTPEQQNTWYRADAFRSSDHDPVVVDLNLRSK